MAINETISGNTPSSAVVPAAAVSECYAGRHDKGMIQIEALPPGGEWTPIETIRRGRTCLNTPDEAVQYRFRPSSLEEPVHVYFGP